VSFLSCVLRFVNFFDLVAVKSTYKDDFLLTVMGNSDYRGDAVVPSLAKYPQLVYCKRSFIVNAGTESYIVRTERRL
jgi:hypothetical protein